MRGWSALGCNNLTAFGPGMNGRRRIAKDVTQAAASGKVLSVKMQPLE